MKKGYSVKIKKKNLKYLLKKLKQLEKRKFLKENY